MRVAFPPSMSRSKSKYLLAAAWLGSLGALIGCGVEESRSAPCKGERCDDPNPACAQILVDSSGRNRTQKQLLAALHDRFIESVYAPGTQCPVKLEGIVPLVQAGTRAQPCSLQTRVITEQAQLLGVEQGSFYRAVTSCDAPGGIVDALFSTFGFHGFKNAPPGLDPSLHVDASGTPDALAGGAGGVEIIAFDESAGVFNFYKEVEGRMHFFGNSIDFITDGPGGPDVISTRGCANCHTGGGPVMKELTNPWLHWEFARQSPGAAKLVDNRTAFMGQRDFALGLESQIIEPALAQWNRTRYRHLVENGKIAALLEPLFCPVEVNIETNAKADGLPLFVPGNFFSSERLPAPPIEMPFEDYAAIREAIDQRVTGVAVGSGPVRDTIESFAFPKRSFADENFVDLLETGVDDVPGVVDRELIEDVSMVDFTRPVFSTERCDLLASLPNVRVADLGEPTPRAVRQLFIDALAAAPPGTPGAQLRDAFAASLEGERRFDYAQTVDQFAAACRSRQTRSEERVTVSGHPTSRVHVDLVRLRSLQRKLVFQRDGFLDDLASGMDAAAARLASSKVTHPGLARPVVGAMPVFEFAATMATDDVVPSLQSSPNDLLTIHPAARLSPLDCRLVDEFVGLP